MKKLILALALITIPMAVMGMEENKDEEINSLNTTAASISMKNEDMITYSDEMPQLKLVWEGKKNLTHFFNERKFYDCKEFIRLSDKVNNGNYLYSQSNKEELSEKRTFFFVKKNYCSIIDINLEKINLQVNEIVFSNKKWDIPRPVKFYDGDDLVVNTLSWKYVDIILHETPKVGSNYPFCESRVETKILFNRIKEISLEKSIVRLLSCSDGKKTQLYIAYNNEEELNNGMSIIKYL